MNLYAASVVMSNDEKFSIFTISLLAESDAEAKGIIYERFKDKHPNGEIYGIQVMKVRQDHIDAVASNPTNDALTQAVERGAVK